MCTETEMKSSSPSAEVGKYVLLPQRMEMAFHNGVKVVAPVTANFNVKLGIDAGTIIDIACKLLGICGGGGGGGGSGCYVITGPDGTTITICPPPKLMAIA